MRNIGVVYLYRFLEGEDPVRRFVASYRNHRPGVDHDLYVVLKGFPDGNSLAQGRRLFSDIQAQYLEQADIGLDIGSYRHAARIVESRRLLFLNTFSQIQADNWLYHFDQALGDQRVGLVGATGSWLSNSAVYEAALKYLLDKMRIRQNWLFSPTTDADIMSRPNGRNLQLYRYLLAPFQYGQRLYEYGRYPNPHIRTNAFMIERERFLSLHLWKLMSKGDAYKFESGRNSMTKQIVGQGLRPIVVNRHGDVYDTSKWKEARTFWTDQQENLLIADNQTLGYTQANQWQRRRLENLAWVHPWKWGGQSQNRRGVDIQAAADSR
jgi:hypothetical protein